jgi:hypothetical protein
MVSPVTNANIINSFGNFDWFISNLQKLCVLRGIKSKRIAKVELTMYVTDSSSSRGLRLFPPCNCGRGGGE